MILIYGDEIIMNILVVEDEIIVAEFITAVLKKYGHTVVNIVDNGKDAIKIIEDKDIDLALLDININGTMDGIQLAREINLFRRQPVLFLSAYADHDTVSEAVEEYVVGYLVKPADERSIFAALKVVENYFKFSSSNVIKNQLEQISDEITYDPRTKALLYNNELIKLTKTEFKLFDLLYRYKNSTISYESIILSVWEGESVSPSALRFTIMNLRKKLPGVMLKNIQKEGYSLLL